jgi:hypothetical protein
MKRLFLIIFMGTFFNATANATPNTVLLAVFDHSRRLQQRSVSDVIRVINPMMIGIVKQRKIAQRAILLNAGTR